MPAVVDVGIIARLGNPQLQHVSIASSMYARWRYHLINIIIPTKAYYLLAEAGLWHEHIIC